MIKQQTQSMCSYLISRGLNPEFVIAPWQLREVHGRMILPYLGWSGVEIGWSGRAMTDDLQPKYLNNKGFDRKLWLYGLHQERHTIPLLCEGQLDAIALWSCGYTAYAVAGSELSLVQAAHIAGISNVVIIYPDQPKPGAPVLAERWSHNLARLGVTSVFPPSPWPDNVEGADPAWLHQHDPSYLKSQVKSAIVEAQKWT